METGNVSEITIQQKIEKQPKATYGSSMNGEETSASGSRLQLALKKLCTSLVNWTPDKNPSHNRGAWVAQ